MLHSTVTTLLEATDSWACDIDIGNVNGVVFLDLKKEFDTVDHDSRAPSRAKRAWDRA